MGQEETDQQMEQYVRHQRLRARNAQMAMINRIALCLLIIVVCAILPVTALPSLAESDSLEDTYHGEWMDKLKVATDAKDSADREYRAIQQDPRYLEIKARERLKWSKPGERILVFPPYSPDDR